MKKLPDPVLHFALYLSTGALIFAAVYLLTLSYAGAAS